MPRQLFLGIDGGQTATKALIGDERGRIVGSGQAGPCNHAAAGEGRRKLAEAVTSAVSEALGKGNPPLKQVRFRAACCGMSGGPEDKREILRELIRCEDLDVTTDAHVALIGGAAGAPAIVVIAGTGSIALGRNSEDRWARAGGWGYVFGDEGGAFDLVRQALRAALREEEGWGRPTALREKLLAAAGAATANELLHWFYTDRFPRARVAAFAPLVEEAAEEGDAEADVILATAGDQLASLARAVGERLFPESAAVPVIHAGGVFRCQRIRGRFRRQVERGGRFAVTAPRYEPAAGALIRAGELAGLRFELQFP